MRGGFFVLLFLIGFANAVLPALKDAARSLTPGAALISGGGINWIVWLSALLGANLAWRAEYQPPTKRDLYAAAVFSALVAWPMAETSWLSLAGISAYVIASARGAARLRGAAVIFFAITVAMFWAKFIATFWGSGLEALDTWAISSITGIAARGNLVYFADGSGTGVMTWGCSSFSNASMVFLFWVALTRSVRPAPKRSEIGIVGMMFATVFLINSMRLLLTTRSFAQFEIWHGPIGATIVNLLLLVTTLLWAAFGLRREILA